MIAFGNLTAAAVAESFNRSGEFTDKMNIQNLKFKTVYIDDDGDPVAVYTGDLWDDTGDGPIPFADMFVRYDRKRGLLGSF